MFYSPLRYPGGKGKITPLIRYIIKNSNMKHITYIEPFAGGAGVGLELLETGVVENIVINDLDKGIYSFWRAIKEEPERFITEIRNATLNIEEWKRQKEISESNKYYSFELGFATFYLNRTNRSGIISGGVIGGANQEGKYKMDARFNKENLIKRIEKIALRRHHIYIYNKDVQSFLKNYLEKFENYFIYFDPPYFEKGSLLYMNALEKTDHINIRDAIEHYVDGRWIMTYDNVNEIKEIYSNYEIRQFELNYSVEKKRRAKEIIIFHDPNIIPDNEKLNKNGIKFFLDICNDGNGKIN